MMNEKTAAFMVSSPATPVCRFAKMQVTITSHKYPTHPVKVNVIINGKTKRSRVYWMSGVPEVTDLVSFIYNGGSRQAMVLEITHHVPTARERVPAAYDMVVSAHA